MDMGGNVWELTNTTCVSNLDTQIQDAQLIDSQDNPNLESYMDTVFPTYEERVVLKGGAATSNFIGIRNSFQYAKHSFKQNGDFVGFRCVKI
jgi:formylglycine-generating enzyme required for sulfatase activity